MSRITQHPVSNYLRDLSREQKRKRKRATIQPVPPDESAQQASWLGAPTFMAGETTDPGDALGQLRPADAIRNQEQKKKLTIERDLPRKADLILAAVTTAKEPAVPVLPADKIPFAGTGPELANHIIRTHLQAIAKAKAEGKKMGRIKNTTLILAEVPRYYIDRPDSKRHGTSFIPENVRTAWIRSKKKVSAGY
jgi:hypothetical protein